MRLILPFGGCGYDSECTVVSCMHVHICTFAPGKTIDAKDWPPNPAKTLLISLINSYSPCSYKPLMVSTLLAIL